MKNIVFSIVIMTSLFCLPKFNFGQAPNLRSTNSFALFTSAGAFNNIGSTDIIGDVGTNSGSFSLLPDGNIVGEIYVEDSISAIAQLDVDSAYSFLIGIDCDSTIGTTLGNGQILEPKIYCLNAASNVIGDLILDGKGDPNSLFIFKINGILSTSISSKVILINSASYTNVYWQINGAVVLGDSSVFNGSIIAAGEITLLEWARLTGRGLSTGGAIFLHNNLIEMQPPPLPIELVSFSASPNGFNFRLDWSTASETNNDFFTILRSKNGISFEELNKVQGSGNSNKVLYYSAIDNTPLEGSFYYQLKQTDYDGNSSLSNIVSVNFDKPNKINIYPNPFYSSINILIGDEVKLDNCVLKIYNKMGIEVMNTKINNQITNIETSFLPLGTYLYNIIENSKTVQSGTILSQK
jgi:hypothetical protein